MNNYENGYVFCSRVNRSDSSEHVLFGAPLNFYLKSLQNHSNQKQSPSIFISLESSSHSLRDYVNKELNLKRLLVLKSQNPSITWHLKSESFFLHCKLTFDPKTIDRIFSPRFSVIQQRDSTFDFLAPLLCCFDLQMTPRYSRKGGAPPII